MLNEVLTISQNKNLTIAEKEVTEELKQFQDWKNFPFQKELPRANPENSDP